MEQPLYFRRYTESVVERAHALEIITTQQYALILKFYNKDLFILEGHDAVDTLRTFIPDLEEIDYDVQKNLYILHVKTWPHLKVMCLKCAPSNPCIWKYFDEQDNELFEYRMNTFSILCPAAVTRVDSMDSTDHGLD